EMGGASAAGTDGVEQGQLAVGPVDREGADGAFVGFAFASGLIGGIEASAGGVQSQATRAGSQFVHAAGRQAAGGAIQLKEVNTAPVSRGQIHLSGRHIGERRAVGANVGQERGLARAILEPERSRQKRGGPREHDGSLEKGAAGELPREWFERRSHHWADDRRRRLEQSRRRFRGSRPFQAVATLCEERAAASPRTVDHVGGRWSSERPRADATTRE